MATTRFADHLTKGTFASRPAATTLPAGSLYSATDTNVVYQSDGTTWSTYATVGGGGGGGSLPYVNLVTDYGVATSNSAASNATKINQALADVTTVGNAALGKAVYLPGAGIPYPTTTITLPSEPVHFFGDGPALSVLSTTSATLLTYVNTTPALRGTSDPWSSNATVLGGANAALHYRNKFWNIHDLGFTKSDNWGGASGIGLNFPNWDMTGWGSLSPAAGGYDALLMFMSDCLVTNFNGAGISYLINGLRGESKFARIIVDGCKNEGVIYGSDQVWAECSSNNNGYEGWWVDGRNGQLIGAKAYSNGTLNGTSRGAGFYLNSGGGGMELTACYAQDNFGPGYELHAPVRINLSNCIADRNCQGYENAGVLISDPLGTEVIGMICTDSRSNNNFTTASGVNSLNSATLNCVATTGFPSSGSLWLYDLTNGNSTKVTYTGLATGPIRFTGCGNHPATTGGELISQYNLQRHAVHVTNTGGTTSARSKFLGINEQWNPGGAAPIGDAVDPSSNLSGVNVEINASGGGIYNLAFSATPTPDPYLGQTNVMPVTGTTTIGIPANKHNGQLLTMYLTQGGAGGFVVSWNAIYVFQTAWTNTGNTTGKRSRATFQYDGTNWICIDHGANVWF